MRRRTFLALVGGVWTVGCVGDGGIGTETANIGDIKDESRVVEYNKLMRNSERYVDEFVHFPAGQIVQVLGNEDEGFQFRVNVTQADYTWEDDVLVRWGGERFLEDDIVEVWGQFNGLVTYETVLGSERTIPDVTAREIAILEEA